MGSYLQVHVPEVLAELVSAHYNLGEFRSFRGLAHMLRHNTLPFIQSVLVDLVLGVLLELLLAEFRPPDLVEDVQRAQNSEIC